jgi:hypothetical protein
MKVDSGEAKKRKRKRQRARERQRDRGGESKKVTMRENDDDWRGVQPKDDAIVRIVARILA